MLPTIRVGMAIIYYHSFFIRSPSLNSTLKSKHIVGHMALASCVKREDASKHPFDNNIVVIHGYLVQDGATRAYARTRPPPATAMTIDESGINSWVGRPT